MKYATSVVLQLSCLISLLKTTGYVMHQPV